MTGPTPLQWLLFAVFAAATIYVILRGFREWRSETRRRQPAADPGSRERRLRFELVRLVGLSLGAFGMAALVLAAASHAPDAVVMVLQFVVALGLVAVLVGVVGRLRG